MSPASKKTFFYVSVALFTGAALWDNRAALFSCLALFLGVLIVPAAVAKSWQKVILVLLVTMNLLLLVRFTAIHAVSGVVAGGQRAGARNAVSRLRQIIFAQNIARERALVDSDGDGIGEALSMAELTSGLLRTGEKTQPLLLRYQPTSHPDHFLLDGYLFTVQIPTPSGEFSPSGSISQVLAESAERLYVVYAWPASAGAGRSIAAADQHERIVWVEDPIPSSSGGGTPSFDAAFSPQTQNTLASDSIGRDGNIWKRWKGKSPRRTLVGDKIQGASRPE